MMSINKYSFAKSINKNRQKPLIIVVDDDKSIRFVLKKLFNKYNYDVELAGNFSSLMRILSETNPSLLITDIKLPDGDILNNLSKIKSLYPNLPIIVISAQSNLLTAVKSAQKGVLEYFSKPFDMNAILELVKKTISYDSSQSNSFSSYHKNSSTFFTDIIGTSEPMQELYRSISKLINNKLTVLITGETGTGKELIAKTIHKLIYNDETNFTSYNMGNENIQTLEKLFLLNNKSEKNSHAKTFYLQSIDDMNLDNQKYFLRILQNFSSKDSISNKNRIIISTNRELPELLNKGHFREDLYYRINVIPLFVPPLRNRTSDLPDLVNFFNYQNFLDGLPEKHFDIECYNQLLNYEWPGNVRELKNLIQRISILYPETIINKKTVIKELKKSLNKTNMKKDNFSDVIEHHIINYFKNLNYHINSMGIYEKFIKDVERPLLKVALKNSNGNQIKASKLLGINRNTFRKKIKEFELKDLKKDEN